MAFWNNEAVVEGLVKDSPWSIIMECPSSPLCESLPDTSLIMDMTLKCIIWEFSGHSGVSLWDPGDSLCATIVSLWTWPWGPLCESPTTMEAHYGHVLVAHYLRASPPQWSLIMDMSWWPIIWEPPRHNGVSLWTCPGGPLFESLPATMESHYGRDLEAHYVRVSPPQWSLIMDVSWWPIIWEPPRHNGVSLWRCPGGPLCESLPATMESHYGRVLVAHYLRASPPHWSVIMEVSWWPIIWEPPRHNGVSLWTCPGGPLCESLPSTLECHYGGVLVAHYLRASPPQWSLIMDVSWWPIMWESPLHTGVSLWMCPGGPLFESLPATMESHYGRVLVAHYVRVSPPHWSVITEVSWWPIIWEPPRHNGVSLWTYPGGPLCESSSRNGVP